MTAAELGILIGIGTTSIISIIGAVFAGLAVLRAGAAVKRTEAVQAEVAVVKKQTDGTLSEAHQQTILLRAQLDASNATHAAAIAAANALALAKAEGSVHIPAVPPAPLSAVEIADPTIVRKETQ